MSTEPTQPFKWLTNARCPFSPGDQAWLDKLLEYRIGAPQQAKDRPTAYSLQQLQDFNIVGVYVTERAYRAPNPDKITQDMARKALKDDFEVLTGHLANYLDENCHFVGRQ